MLLAFFYVTSSVSELVRAGRKLRGLHREPWFPGQQGRFVGSWCVLRQRRCFARGSDPGRSSKGHFRANSPIQYLDHSATRRPGKGRVRYHDSRWRTGGAREDLLEGIRSPASDHAGLTCLNMFAAMHPRKKDAIRTNRPGSDSFVSGVAGFSFGPARISMKVNAEVLPERAPVRCPEERQARLASSLLKHNKRSMSTGA